MNICTNTELNLNEMEMITGGIDLDGSPDGTSAKAMAALASGAVSGSGIANGTHRPGGAIVATIGGAMGAVASVVNFFFGD